MSPHRRPVPMWYVLLAVLISVLAVAGAGIAYTAHVQRQSDQQWCELLVVLDEAYSSTPPQTELGRRVAGSVHMLRVGFDCP